MTKSETSNSDIVTLINKKIQFFHDLIQKTILHVQKNKILDVLGASEVNNCIRNMYDLVTKLNDITPQMVKNSNNNVINILQHVNNELSAIFKTYGTDSLDDLLWVCFGNNSATTYSQNVKDKAKFDLFLKYFHPISYKSAQMVEQEPLFCSEYNASAKQFFLRVYGMQVYIYNYTLKKGILVSGMIDDVIIEFVNNEYLKSIKEQLEKMIPNTPEFTTQVFSRYIASLSLKDYFINKPTNIFEKYAGYISNLNLIKSKTLTQNVKEFIQTDLYSKRLTIIQLLIQNQFHENQYLAYLLFDLLSNNANDNIDTHEQTLIFDSLPWIIKQYFKDAMKNTIGYTSDLSQVDQSKIPIEQQICLLNVNDSVKEKAMQKLKEVKSKADDSGSKARQYLEGLLKIPFGVYRKEPILTIMDSIKTKFMTYVNTGLITGIEKKDKYTNMEILKYLRSATATTNVTPTADLNKLSKQELLDKVKEINVELKQTGKSSIKTAGKTKEYLIEQIQSHKVSPDIHVEMKTTYDKINTYMVDIKQALDKSVYGHEKAKQQIERIIGQWINGNQDGYCLGFEGAHGIGKTSLAKKGLSNCLKDADGTSRPFSMIQLGGDANGTTLHGHSYTYVGSTWGNIVQILMDTKCMNPIILIDEVDKISRTEHGKEIVGILIHLLDPTQNDSFQDKYFSGINIDLSKALFILSYNDVEAIDKILLDRIHRIKFDNLSLEDKIVVCNDYLLPEIYDKFGLTGMIQIPQDVLTFIIETYTLEPGVRKLKEQLYELVGEINLRILKEFDHEYTIPIVLTIDDIRNKYFNEKHEVKIKQIHPTSQVGVINCLFATQAGFGGILPANAKMYPSGKFLDLKLTGLLDQMMQESFQISLTLAYNLTSTDKKDDFRKKYDGDNKYGIHLHMGDGAVQKSGNSAGIAITLLFYSMLNDVKIKNDFAVTGEAHLDGGVYEIGALDKKIFWGIKSGVKNFIFPKENIKDFNEFMKTYKDTDYIKGINFYPIEHINEAISLIME
jgi:ATP-dependent Lon protease